MTNEERRQAFARRLQGQSWETIGAALGYAAPTVMADLKRCVRQGARPVSRVYPELNTRIQEQYGGCVRAFALDCGINPSTVYSILGGHMALSPRNASRMARTLGMGAEQLLKGGGAGVSV